MRMSLIAVLLFASVASGQQMPAQDMPPDPQHAALMLTVSMSDATVTVNGTESLSQIFAQRRRATNIWIPEGAELLVDGKFSADDQVINWIGGMGLLHFPSAQDSHLRVRHVALDKPGGIRVGDVGPEGLKVAVKPANTCRITLEPRGKWFNDGTGTGYWNSTNDPNDLSGGLISAGEWTLLGAIKDTNTVPTSAKAGDVSVSVGSSGGWLPGDELLIPGLLRGTKQHELKKIASICRTAAGETIMLDSPLKFDHTMPDGRAVTISNMTRNVIIESAVTDRIHERGHTMIHHVDGGTVTQGVEFRNLGRTSGTKMFTPPGQDLPDSQRNTIARYPFHVHDEDFKGSVHGFDNPHWVKHCIVRGSTKHAFVNHGGFVGFEDCVAYDFASSGFMMENGSEVGAVTRCSAVKATEPHRPELGTVYLENRKLAGDLAFRGTGYWNQSPLVYFTRNFYADCGWAGHEQEFRPTHDAAIFKRPADIPNYCMCEKPEDRAKHKLTYPWLGRHDIVYPPNYVNMLMQFGDSHVEDLTGTGAMTGFSALYNRTSQSRIWMGWSTAERIRCWNCDFYGIHATYSHFQSFDDVILHRSSQPITPLTTGCRLFNNILYTKWNKVETRGFNTSFEDPRLGLLSITNSKFDKPITVWAKRGGQDIPADLIYLELINNQGQITVNQ